MTVPLLTLMVLIVAFGAALRQAQGRLAVPVLTADWVSIPIARRS